MQSQKMNTTTIIGLMILCFWLVILFLDGVFSYKHLAVQTSIVPPALSSPSPTLSPSLQQTTTPSDSTASVPSMMSGVIHQQVGNSQIFQDLHVLEYLYTKNKNPDLLQPLVEKFLENYQFDKANQYLSLLIKDPRDYYTLPISPRKIIYTRLHDSAIRLDNASALNDIMILIKGYRSRDMITQDDEYFYKGLASLWIYDYASASASFSKITDALYNDFKLSYESSLANFIKIKNPPTYYRDGLVALTLLKNGYFSFAKRLSLHALLANNNYVLSYQVLAYANFLTHNRESAKDYFLKLADFDATNALLYKFLIGVSYYRYGDYEQSILYLNQVTDPALKTDVYRYMLLGYIKEEDTTNMIRIWQNILGQSDIQPSDFALFFDHMFYMPFRIGQPFALYNDNPQLTDIYIGKCSTLFAASQADVCVYGEVGLQLGKGNLSGIGPKLLSLTEKYHQSHLYHLLGDYYVSLNLSSEAKNWYLKALSISDSLSEQSLLQTKIAQLTK